jgi:outer membrane cobalamin receptor
MPPHTHLTFIALICVCARAENAAAQSTSVVEVEPVQVTASRLPDPTPIGLTVLDEPRIEAQHGADVLDLLRATPGISTTQPGGPGGVSEVFLRSAESNFTVVLIDGVRVNDPSNPRGGGYDFSTLNAVEIERVEIARSALSAVHGSDAMAGAINIVTKRPSAEGVAQVRAEGGTEDFMRTSALLSGPLSDAVRGSVKASYVDFGDAIEGSSQRLATVQADIEAGSAHEGMGNIRSGIRYAERDRHAFADASGGPLYAAIREPERAHAEETSAWAQATRAVTSAWSVDVTTSYFSRRERTTTPAIAPGEFDAVPASMSDSRFHRGQLTLSNLWIASPALDIGAGIDVQLEDGERDGEMDLGFATLPSDFDMDRLLRSVYTEARYRFAQGFELHGALRLDDSDDDTARTSGRILASYTHPSSAMSFHASWSNGHKQPSFYALGDTLVGNPELEVETSETIELGAQRKFADQKLTAAVTAFRSEYEDLIDFDFSTFRLVNRSRARIDGVELSLAARLTPTLTARAHATASDIELAEPGAALLHRPESYGGVQVGWTPMARWSLQANAQIVGKREGSSVPTGARTLQGYERLDVALSHELSTNATLFIAADNVLDEDYQEAVGFPSAGLRVRIGAAVTF